MRAIVLTECGPAENLIIKEIDKPTISEGEVLVKVKSISINPVDTKTRIGKGVYSYGNIRNQTDLILGWDISGTVTESNSSLFKEGDEVFGMVNFPGLGNAYAEYVAAPGSHLALKPKEISHVEAAAGTLALLTAWQVLVKTTDIKANDRVLIHAASGGVGHYAVQLAKHLGAYVIGTSSGANRNFVLSLGADEHIDYRIQTLEKSTENIDFVLDCLGTENVEESLEVVRNGGKIVSIVAQFNDILKKKLDAKNVTGEFLLVNSNGEDMSKLAELLRSGKIKSHVSKVFNFDEMVDAHLQIDSGRTVGKIVVNV